MAGTMTCDFCESMPAAFLIGNTATGDQQAVCNGCLIAWCMGQLQTQLDAEGLQLLATELYKSTLPPDAQEDGAPPKGRKRAKPAASAVEQPDQPAQEGEAKAAAPDG